MFHLARLASRCPSCAAEFVDPVGGKVGRIVHGSEWLVCGAGGCGSHIEGQLSGEIEVSFGTVFESWFETVYSRRPVAFDSWISCELTERVEAMAR